MFGSHATEEANFNQHPDELNKITTEFDSHKALLLLASLPSSFDNIVTTLLFGKHTLRLDELVTTLLVNETRRGNNRFSGDDLVAKVTKDLVGDEDGQERRRKGANVQDRGVGSSNATTAMRKVT